MLSTDTLLRNSLPTCPNKPLCVYLCTIDVSGMRMEWGWGRWDEKIVFFAEKLNSGYLMNSLRSQVYMTIRQPHMAQGSSTKLLSKTCGNPVLTEWRF